jgi:hypothetical protein
LIAGVDSLLCAGDDVMEEAQSIFAAAAGTIPARARFIVRFVGTTTFSSITLGAVLGQCGAMLPCGPLIPFFVGAHIGYVDRSLVVNNHCVPRCSIVMYSVHTSLIWW